MEFGGKMTELVRWMNARGQWRGGNFMIKTFRYNEVRTELPKEKIIREGKKKSSFEHNDFRLPCLAMT